MDKNIAIQFVDICFSYDGVTKNLDSLNFDILKNEYVCILGHNGSGKSTVSKVIMGLFKPLSGYMKIFGEKITSNNVDAIRKNIGIIFQNPDSQFIGLTTEDDIAFGLENRNIHPSKMKQIIDEVCEIIDVRNLLQKDSVSLSGGQKQSVAIASVLAMNPDIIIFDEATSMLDPKSKNNLKKIMLDLKNKSNKTIISITHDMDEVLNADKVIILEKGKVKIIGKPSEIFVNEKMLHSLALDFPFNLKLAWELKKKNIIKKVTLDSNVLVDLICKK